MRGAFCAPPLPGPGHIRRALGSHVDWRRENVTGVLLALARVTGRSGLRTRDLCRTRERREDITTCKCGV